MQVLNLENEWTLLTALETHLPQRLEGAGSDRLWRECGNGLRSLFHPKQLEEIGGRCLGLHADFLYRQAYLLDDRYRALGLADATVMAQHINQGMIGNRAAIGETASFKLGDPFLCQPLTKFVQQSRFAPARFGDDANDLTTASLDLGKYRFEGG